MILPQREGRRGSWIRAGTSCALVVLSSANPRPAAGREEPAIEAVAARVAEQIAARQPEPPIAIQVRADSAELARAVTTALAAALARRKLAPLALETPASSSGEAEARAAGARALVRLTLSFEQGELRARGDLLGTWVNFWSGRASTRPAGPAAALLASAPADAVALALDGPRRPPQVGAAPAGELRLSGAVFGRLAGWTAALAAGDLDGDRRDEVVALTDDEILVFSPEGRVLARRALRALPYSPTPCREPFGAATVDEGGRRLAYLSAQRARGEWLALDPTAGLRLLGRLDRMPLAYASGVEISGALVPGQNTFEAAIAAPAPFNTLSVFSGSAGPELLAVFPSGTAVWRRGVAPAGPSVELRGLGAASALADVDGDGASEIATTEPAHAPAPEVLRVLRAPGGAGAPHPNEVRFRTELGSGRAMQMAAADLDADGADELVIALWLPDGATELQVFRRPP